MSDIDKIAENFSKKIGDFTLEDMNKLFSEPKTSEDLEILKSPKNIDEFTDRITDELSKQILFPIVIEIHFSAAEKIKDGFLKEKDKEKFRKDIKSMIDSDDIYERVVGYYQDLYVFQKDGFLKDYESKVKADIAILKSQVCELIDNYHEEVAEVEATMLEYIFRIHAKYMSLYAVEVLDDSDNRLNKAMGKFYDMQWKMLQELVEDRKKKVDK